jgi:Flp pilus assembly protein TadD
MTHASTPFAPAPLGAPLTDVEHEAVYGLGYSLLMAGRLEDALTVFGRLLRVDPYAAKVWQASGVALHQLGATVPAAVMLTTASLLGGSADLPPATLAALSAAAREAENAGGHPCTSL